MSEYQYYEFQAIDRALTTKEIAILRSCSTRATITPTSFVNHYEYGSFKGDEDEWMDRYFDAFMYTANWGTNVLKLRLPAEQLPLSEVQAYAADNVLDARKKRGNVIVTFASDDETVDSNEEQSSLSSLVSIRHELLRGDRRALYLGWLAGVQNEVVDEDELEPEVPAGLRQLSATLAALVEFLRIDESLVAVASRKSAPLPPAPSRRAVTKWVKQLPAPTKDALLARIVNDDPAAASEVRQKFHSDQRPIARSAQRKPRTAGMLLEAAHGSR
ncbi:MAG: hypothetical protein JWP01_510 [Myxococcales bacterium]|nr:hypothetical protein [Myxococcales bacterium]